MRVLQKLPPLPGQTEPQLLMTYAQYRVSQWLVNKDVSTDELEALLMRQGFKFTDLDVADGQQAWESKVLKKFAAKYHTSTLLQAAIRIIGAEDREKLFGLPVGYTLMAGGEWERRDLLGEAWDQHVISRLARYAVDSNAWKTYGKLELPSPAQYAISLARYAVRMNRLELLIKPGASLAANLTVLPRVTQQAVTVFCMWCGKEWLVRSSFPRTMGRIKCVCGADIQFPLQWKAVFDNAIAASLGGAWTVTTTSGHQVTPWNQATPGV
jgi:hypothetical protein